MEDYRIDFDSITWTVPMPGARFKAYKQNGRQLRLVEFSREFVEPDWCTRGHIGILLEGKLEIDFSGIIVTFKPGDGLFIPAGEKGKHMAKAVTGVARLLLVEDI